MTRRASALGLTLVALLIAGCGQQRTPPPDTTTPDAPRGSTDRSFPSAGVSFTAPADWTITPGQGSQVATIASATSAVGIFRYARQEQLPQSRPELDQAAGRIVAAAKVRDATFAATGMRRTRLDGQPAVEIRGTGTVSGRPKTIRSVHIYARSGEVVVDSLADARDFARVDAAVFTPLLRSLELERAQG